MAIKFNQVNHLYKGVSKDDNLEAITNINLDIAGSGEMIAIVGKTGSGKSTLMQHMNGLLLPSKGEVTIFDTVIYSKKKRQKINQVRKRVGMVFQFPEYQLFEETVLKDVMFGPKNFKMTDSLEKAKNALEMVGIDESLYEKSPFKLSGGQMRRVAIAGILAMEPDILILDEPTRGLDPKGSKEIMDLFYDIHLKYNKSIILITHDMDIVCNYAKRTIVMKNGMIAYDGLTSDLFYDESFKTFHLDKPRILKLVDYLNENGYKIPEKIFTIDDLMKSLKEK